MNRDARAEIVVALHANPPKHLAVLVSNGGDERQSKWLPKRLIVSLHETGRHTRGTTRDGQAVSLPMAHITIPEWLAVREGLV